MTFSLSALQPKIVDIQIEAYGEKHLIPIMPLTYTEWHNVTLSVPRPNDDDFKEDTLVGGKIQSTINRQSAEYIKAYNDYVAELQMRRLALALTRGGVTELQGKPIEEQVAELKGMDAGITKALITWLEREANHKQAARFQPVSGNSDADMSENGLESDI